MIKKTKQKIRPTFHAKFYFDFLSIKNNYESFSLDYQLLSKDYQSIKKKKCKKFKLAGQLHVGPFVALSTVTVTPLSPFQPLLSKNPILPSICEF